MDRTRAARWIPLAAVVAGLVPALSVVADWLQFAVGWPDRFGIGMRTLVVVGLLAAAVVTVDALRRHDRVVLSFDIAALAFGVASVLPRGFDPVATILFLVAQVLLLVFGILLVRLTAGPDSARLQRAAGRLIAVGAGLWIAADVAEQLVFRVWMPPQEALVGIFAIPQVGQFVGFLAAALLFAPPLLRPVGAGVRRLWDTADVR